MDLGRDDGQLVGPLLTLSGDELERLSTLFKLLSDRTRLAILQMLSAGEINVTGLCERLKLPQPTVSHHLGLLRVNRLIDNRRDGKQIFYKLNGRISPAVIGSTSLLKQTKAGKQVVKDVDGDGIDEVPAGMQILGRGYAVQLLSAADVDPTEGAADAVDQTESSDISNPPKDE